MTEDKLRDKKDPKWLIMVYLAGDNSLSAHSIAFLQELEAANPDLSLEECHRRARVVAAFDSPTPLPKGARYLEINRHRDPSNPYKKMKWPLHNDLVGPGHIVVSPDFCNSDGGHTDTLLPEDPREPTAEEALARFLKWVKRHYKAEKYMLILFGHGTLVAGNTFLGDSNPPSYLKLGDFAKILGDFGKIDILACDNCVMNGIESAVQLYRAVDYLLGSQGLMLANGWPVREIIETVRKYYYYTPREIARQILRASVVNLLDFTLMERSSEQGICDVTKFGRSDQIITAVRALSGGMQDGLEFKWGKNGRVLRYPIVVDLVRLARLEAQSYWSETFVDLYDFAALLLKKCREFLAYPNVLLQPRDLIRVVRKIEYWCAEIVKIFMGRQIVPLAYYVGPQLQYSHGISIFFPWTLPEGPITFEPVPASATKPKEYKLRTPFEEYKDYLFAKPRYGDWERFLIAFFKATLRNVRLVEYTPEDDPRRIDNKFPNEFQTPVIDLQKSSSSTGEEDDCPRVKNYPRRFYLSPPDCDRKSEVFKLHDNVEPEAKDVIDNPDKVSYLGWNIRGLVADVLGLEKGKKK
jgi:hypothetical protein